MSDSSLLDESVSYPLSRGNSDGISSNVIRHGGGSGGGRVFGMCVGGFQVTVGVTEGIGVESSGEGTIARLDW